VDRALDRWQVSKPAGGSSVEKDSGLRVLWLLIGPGVLVFLGENDAPSMLSYSADGARYGIGFFIPFVILTFVMGFIVQEMTVRLGAVTHRGHAELIFDRFGKFWGFFAMGDLVFGNFLTLVTSFIGVRAGLGFFGIPAGGRGCGSACNRGGRDYDRPLLDLGTNHAGAGDLQWLFIPAAILARSELAFSGPALWTWMPLPSGSHYEILLLILATDRRDRDAVDAFLPAKRRGG